jgi:hypothetical protein
MIDFPCTCGHKKNEHKTGMNGRFFNRLSCMATLENGMKYADMCFDYKSDNLLYLESLNDPSR